MWLTTADVSHPLMESVRLSLIKTAFSRGALCYCLPVCAHSGTHLESAFVSPLALNWRWRRNVKTRGCCVPSLSPLRPPSVCYHTPKRSVLVTGVIIFTQLWLTGRAPASSWQPVYFWEHMIKFSSDLEQGSPLSPFPLRARVAGGLS